MLRSLVGSEMCIRDRPHVVDGYRFGAALDDKLRLQLNINGNEGDFVSKIVMPTATGITTNTGEKRYVVDNAVGVSSISSNICLLYTSDSTKRNY